MSLSKIFCFLALYSKADAKLKYLFFKASSVCTPKSMFNPPLKSKPKVILGPLVSSKEGTENPTPKRSAKIKTIKRGLKSFIQLLFGVVSKF
ncbi:hypothetical protein TH0631_02330 [Helicobacter pylori]